MLTECQQWLFGSDRTSHAGRSATAADPEAVPNGIAFDRAAGRLFITGKLWSRLFEISAPELRAAGVE
jgi:glutamine cyclotransferase